MGRMTPLLPMLGRPVSPVRGSPDRFGCPVRRKCAAHRGVIAAPSLKRAPLDGQGGGLAVLLVVVRWCRVLPVRPGGGSRWSAW